ncbi:MAG: DUF2807 domain-containing protein [Bacteroidales bacterium]|nr:DUF2807 domain-containing protein [Bacteroidales bacterium]
MKKLAAFFIIVSLAAGIAAGQTTVKETRNVEGFSRVNFGIAGNLNIKIGPEFSVVLEGTKSDLGEVITEVSKDRLLIKQESWRFNFNEKVNVYITMPEIEGLSVSGSGRAEILDAVKDADNLSLSVSGSGKLLTAGLVVDNLNCSISGSGNIIIGSEGNADTGDISISGSGSYSGEAFEIDHLVVKVSGSGNCFCKAGDSLDAAISGSGNVNYIGDPKINAHVSGSGHVRAAK